MDLQRPGERCLSAIGQSKKFRWSRDTIQEFEQHLARRFRGEPGVECRLVPDKATPKLEAQMKRDRRVVEEHDIEPEPARRR